MSRPSSSSRISVSTRAWASAGALPSGTAVSAAVSLMVTSLQIPRGRAEMLVVHVSACCGSCLAPGLVLTQPLTAFLGDREHWLIANGAHGDQPAVRHVLEQILAQAQALL